MHRTAKILLSLLVISQAAAYVVLRRSIVKEERAYRYGCADAWLDKNGRNDKHSRWTSYRP